MGVIGHESDRDHDVVEDGGCDEEDGRCYADGWPVRGLLDDETHDYENQDDRKEDRVQEPVRHWSRGFDTRCALLNPPYSETATPRGVSTSGILAAAKAASRSARDSEKCSQSAVWMPTTVCAPRIAAARAASAEVRVS